MNIVNTTEFNNFEGGTILFIIVIVVVTIVGYLIGIYKKP